MKAIGFHTYGSPDVLKLEEVAKPTPGNGEVRVNIHAVSVNSWDWELLRGTPFVNRLVFGILKPKKIKTLGCDIAGTVEAVGKNTTRFQPGDEVFGDLSSCGWGGFAEYVCAPEKALSPKPAGLTFEQAAAVPQAGLLALQGLKCRGEVQPGQTVLITGAGGGAGTFAVQMAKLFGAEVTGVDSTEKLDAVRLLGADHVVDYTKENFTQNGQQYDLILDIAGYHSIFDCRRSLKPGGGHVFVGGANAQANQAIFLAPLISLTGSRKMGLLWHRANKDMALMTEILEAGKVAPVIDRRYPLSEVPKAMRYFGEGHVQGKIVITV